MNKKIQRISHTFSNMPYNLYFCLILTQVFIIVSCFTNIQQNRNQLTYEQGVIRHSSLSRFRRQSPVLGYKNEERRRPVVVMPGVPPLYRGPGSSYGPSSSAGVQEVEQQANGPTVVANRPDDNYIIPVVNSPYAVPSTRL